MKPPRHIVWSTDTLDLSDPWQRRWYVRQVLEHGRSEALGTITRAEIADVLEELPPLLRQLWRAFLGMQHDVTIIGED